METIIKVKIYNFEVNYRYYNFDYELWMNGELKDEGEYNSDHAWDDLVAFEDMMLNGNEAVKIVLQNL